jgi:hypothetical protein
MVSARLFGDIPEKYVALHNAFDMSKAALPDMRHRAALHSVDHGASVMRLIFPDRIGKASLSELCVQHVNDDQGFDVALDTWLADCETPTFVRIRRRPPEGLEGFASEPEVAAANRWGGQPEDFSAICGYYKLAEKASSHPLAAAVSRNAFSIFFSEMAFGPMITVKTKTGGKKYVPVRDIGECLTLAAFGFIPTLGDVFKTMPRKDWMTGAQVARSRKKRCAIAGQDDLFCEDMKDLDGLHSASVTRADVASILLD